MHVVRLWVKAALWCTLGAVLAAGTLWASAPVKQSVAQRTRHAAIKDHRQVSREVSTAVPVWRETFGSAVGLRATSASSPGIVICAENPYDVQHNDGTVRQLGTLGDGSLVHFGYTWLSGIPDSITDPDRFVRYGAYSTSAGLMLGDCGERLPQGTGAGVYYARAGYVGVEVGSDDNAHLILNMRNEANQEPTSGLIYSSFLFDQGGPGSNAFDSSEVPGSVDAEAMWPHGAIDRGGSTTKTPGDDVYHVCSRASGDIAPYTDELFYWRRVGEWPSSWEGPVVLDHVQGGSLSHHVATDPTDENVAVIYSSFWGAQGLREILFVESANNGADWLAAGIPIFPDPVGPLVNGGQHVVTNYIHKPEAWYDCTGEYDSQGQLHVVWVEPGLTGNGGPCRLMHWSDATTQLSEIASALSWMNAGQSRSRALWIASPQIGFGDGSTLCTDGPANAGAAGATSNLDYVYVTFEQYGGPTGAEANDVSTHNYQNSEIYLSVSNDHGASWSRPVNLTNTQTPGCDGTVPGNECASEIYPSLNLIVNDTLHLFYFLDTDAGSAVFGQGSWTNGQAMYYRIPGGTDAQPLCPDLTPCLGRLLSDSDPDCEYHTTLNPPGTVVENLLITNCGNAVLTGSVGVSPPSATWLQVSSAPFSVPSGGPGNYDSRPVTMDAGDPSVTGEGLYSAQIEITHDDPNTQNPFPIPVDFFVFDEFYCPEYTTLHTDCLWLEVSNTERVGNQNLGLGGLSRLGSDSSWSVYDGSLIIGVPPNPDTLVYRSVYGWGNGYPGFRALSNLTVDTSAYGTFTGDATASARQTTTDSTIGIDVEYVFPQDPDSCEFVLIKYRVTNNTASDMLGLSVGEAVDFDVMPGFSQRALQIERTNSGHLRSDFNLVYQQGVDTTGHAVVGDNTATRFKAGITSIQCLPAPRAWIAPNDPWLYGRPSGGFEEGYLYQEMTKTAFEIVQPSSAADLHSVMIFDNAIDLAAGESRDFQVALVASNTGTDETDLINTTKKAWRYAFGWQEIVMEDTIEAGTPMSYPYRALGSHEDGFAGGCCGCVVSKVYGSPALTIVPGPDPCEGTIELVALGECCYPVFAVFKVTDLCGAYEDVFAVSVNSTAECNCSCPHQGDIDGDSFPTSLDMAALIDILFAGQPDIQDASCPNWRSDLDCDCFATSLDLGEMIDFLFAGGQPPCNPCLDGACGVGCEVGP